MDRQVDKYAVRGSLRFRESVTCETSRQTGMQMVKGVSFYGNCGAASVGNRNECLILPTELIIKGRSNTVKRFEC